MIWIPLIYHKTPPIFSTLYDLFKLKKKVKERHLKHSYDIIHCRSYITSLVGLWMKRNHNVKFIFDMRGFWADERVDGKIWKLGNPLFTKIYKFFKKKEKQFLMESDHIISLTQNAKSEIISWGLPNAPIAVIPTCVDLNLFDPDKIKPELALQAKMNLGIQQNDFIILYLGSWGTWYMTTEMLKFFEKVKHQKKNAKFLILTEDTVDLENFAFKKDVIVQKSARHNIPLYISLAKVAVFFIKPSFSKKASSATKMGELMAMNILIVTNKGWGDVEKIVSDTEVIFENEFWKLNSDQIPPINTRSYCRQNMSLEIGVSLYSGVYTKVLNRSNY